MRYTVDSNLFGSATSAVIDNDTDEVMEVYTGPDRLQSAEAMADGLNSIDAEEPSWIDLGSPIA